MASYKCGHNHNSINIERKNNSELYDQYIKWKYTVGINGSREFCWECYIKNPNLYILE